MQAPVPKIVELIVVMLAVLAPQFLLASQVDGDEFAKATTGVALAGVVVAAYRIWLGMSEKRAKVRAARKALDRDRVPEPGRLEP